MRLMRVVSRSLRLLRSLAYPVLPICQRLSLVLPSPLLQKTAQPTQSSTTTLRVYYCICGEFILVIDKLLTSLSRRKTDNAIIIRAQDSGEAKARVFKLNANPTEPIFLERAKGHERQYRFVCPRCTLPVAYQMSPPPPKSSPFLYILPGALTQVQGQVPPDAFDLGVDSTNGTDEATA